MDEQLLYLNSSYMPLSEGRISVEDRGFQLGDGIYEVVKVMNGCIVWLEDHLVRLRDSLAAIGLTDALSDHPLDTILLELVSRAGLVDGIIYVQITRGCAPREFIFPAPPEPTVLAYTRAIDFPTIEEIHRGVTLHPVRDQRWGRCDIKSTNLLAPVLAKEEAHQAGADEALFVSPGGLVREGGSSNILAVIDGVLRTHPLDHRILGGVTRKHALDIARRLGLTVEERAFTLAEALDPAGGCSEMINASTTKDLLPVVRVGDSVIGSGQAGPVTLALLKAMQEEQARLVGLESLPASL